MGDTVKNQTKRRRTTVGALAPEPQQADVPYVNPDVAAAQEGEVVTFSFSIDNEE